MEKNQSNVKNNLYYCTTRCLENAFTANQTGLYFHCEKKIGKVSNWKPIGGFRGSHFIVKFESEDVVERDGELFYKNHLITSFFEGGKDQLFFERFLGSFREMDEEKEKEKKNENNTKPDDLTTFIQVEATSDLKSKEEFCSTFIRETIWSIIEKTNNKKYALVGEDFFSFILDVVSAESLVQIFKILLDLFKEGTEAQENDKIRVMCKKIIAANLECTSDRTKMTKNQVQQMLGFVSDFQALLAILEIVLVAQTSPLGKKIQLSKEKEFDPTKWAVQKAIISKLKEKNDKLVVTREMFWYVLGLNPFESLVQFFLLMLQEISGENEYQFIFEKNNERDVTPKEIISWRILDLAKLKKIKPEKMFLSKSLFRKMLSELTVEDHLKVFEEVILKKNNIK